MRIGILGGSFNPIHLGHLNSASEILFKMNLDKIYFVVSARPPHKEGGQMAGFHHRYKMVKLATRDNKAFVACDIESTREGPSYTMETMHYFQDKYGSQVYFITGQDAMEDVGSWHSAEALLKSCNFIVMTRPGYDPNILKDLLQGVLSVRYKNLKLKPMVTDNVDIIDSFGVTGSSSMIDLVSVTALDISSSEIRKTFGGAGSARYLVPETVERYIREENIYR